MRPRCWTVLAVLPLLFARAALADDSCFRDHDGVCDEMVRCPLGSDATDCSAACAGAPGPELAGVCAHLAAVAAASAERPPAVDSGSHGAGGFVGMYDGEITAAGGPGQAPIIRHYAVYVPPSYDPRAPAPLLYVFGGFTVDMYVLASYTQLLRTADANGFLVAFMQPRYEDFNGYDVFAWDIYNLDWRNNPDVDFVRELTAQLEREYNVDRTRIFASGHSRGSALSIILAFELPDLIAGFDSESGFIHVDGPSPGRPALAFEKEIAAHAGRKIPGVLVHGRDDGDVDYASSELIASTLTSSGWVEGSDFLFFRLDHVAHEWQPQYNQQIWDFLRAHPLPLDGVAP